MARKLVSVLGRLLLPLALLVAPACTEGAAPPRGPLPTPSVAVSRPTPLLLQVPAGTWGEESQIRLDVDATGTGIEGNCWGGKITQSLTLSPTGHFDVPGSFEEGSGAPPPTWYVPQIYTARYQGWTDGQTLTLTITLPPNYPDPPSPFHLIVIGPFTLTRILDPLRFLGPGCA
ncbi:MAG TPA: hypothetical protein VKY74_25875 [Chloroflexia bacterium]|nr:hypothetical protein [Chloroflexia bacterium]